MNEDATARLDALLNGYERELAGRDQAKAQQATHTREVRDRFVTLRAEVIEPTMRELGEQLKTRGHDYEIQSRETRDVGAGQNDEPSIALTVYPGGASSAKVDPREAPTLTFRSGDVPGQLRVQYVKRLPRGATSSVARSYALEVVTPEVVRGVVMELLEAVFGRKRD